MLGSLLEWSNRGWHGLVLAYSLAGVGLWSGGHLAGQHVRSIRAFAWVALMIMLGSLIAWTVIVDFYHGFFARLPEPLKLLLGMAFIVLVGMGMGFYVAHRMPRMRHQRGAMVLGQDSGRFKRSGSELRFAGQPIGALDEMKHFKILGTTGTGKSTAIRELLEGALSRGDRAVIADPDGNYLKRFYEPARGDVILNPFEPRAGRWDLYAEVIQPHDADQLARSLIPDYDGTDRNWRHYARTFLTAVLRQLHRAQEQDLARLYWLLIMASAEELRGLLAGTPAGPFLGQDSGKFFESVRSVASVQVAALEHVARQSSGDPVSIRRWIREGRGVLFLPYRASEIAVLRHLISTWMRLAIFEAMNVTEERDQRLWFVVDELDALGAIDGLKDALARLRKFGGRCVLGLQSIAQVRGTYGDAEAQTIVENCGNTLILRCSASERGGTAEFASRLIGKREVIRHQHSDTTAGSLFSRAESTQTLSEHRMTEDAVMASEIEQLADLNGFLKIASRAEWVRVRLGA